MKSCDVDKLTLSELYDAITHKEGAKHNVIVPIFQRGKSQKNKGVFLIGKVQRF